MVTVLARGESRIFKDVPGEDVAISQEEKLKVLNWLISKQDVGFFTASEICEACDLTERGNQAHLRHIVAVLRAEGYPVISHHNGFMYTTNVNMIDKCIENLQSRIFGIQRAIDGLESAKESLGNVKVKNPPASAFDERFF